MIASLDGEVLEVRDGSLVVRAGAFGVEVHAPTQALARTRVGESVRLCTQLVVREDTWTLYGFAHEDDLTLFRMLNQVAGVGPKVALALLSTLPRRAFVAAVMDEDPALLASAPGVGKRLAERIAVELRSRLPEHLIAAAESAATAETGAEPAGLSEAARDAILALTQLGFREGKVRAAVSELGNEDPDAGAEDLIRKALARLR